ncbi:MAG: hypothetical protein LBS59_03420 [Puniceicoccales bacterium]|nr:hypothetical protein [Puniceicoccales bacterium]
MLKSEETVSVPLATGATIWMYRDNILMMKGVEEGDLPLTPAKVVKVLAAAGVQLKAGWLPKGKSLIDDTNACQFIRTSTRAGLTGYTVVRTNDADDTPHP